MAFNKNVVPLTTVTTSQDLIVASGAAAVTRLGVGTNGQVLKVVTGAIAWAADTAGGTFNVTAKTTTYTAAYGDVVTADATGGAFTITLPAAVNNSAPIVVKKTDATANAVTITPTAGTIDGAANASISVQNNSFTFVSDGTNWFII